MMTAERQQTVISSEQPVTAGSARGALISLSLSMLLSSLGTSIANVGLPSLAAAFDASFQAIQWVVLAYLLTITALIVGMGRLGDMFGRRRLLLAGLVLFTVASVACGLAPTLAVLIAARAVQGLGAAAMMALAMASVGEIVPKERTGSAMGLLGTMSAVGTALGPSLGGALIAVAGWRAIFLAGVPLGLLALLLACRYLPAARPARTRTDRHEFDIVGTILLALTLAAYALSMTIGNGGTTGLVLLLAAAIGLALFVLVETRAASPLIRLAMLREPIIAAGLAMSALVSTIMMSTLIVGPFYLARGLGLGPAAVGLIISAGPVVSALTGIPAGRIVDRFGARNAIIVGLGTLTMGALALALLPATAGIPGYIGPIVAMTAGYALFQAASNTAVMASAGTERRGLVSGLINLSRNLGLTTGASAMGAVFAWGAGTADMLAAPANAAAAGLHAAFAVAAGLAGLALVIAATSRIAAGKPQ